MGWHAAQWWSWSARSYDDDTHSHMMQHCSILSTVQVSSSRVIRVADAAVAVETADADLRGTFTALNLFIYLFIYWFEAHISCNQT